MNDRNIRSIGLNTAPASRFWNPLTILSVCAAYLCATSPASAQSTNAAPTNAPAPFQSSSNWMQLIGLPPALQAGLSTIGAGLLDAEPYISNKVASIETGAFYDSSLSKGKLGFFLDGSVPLTQQTGVGIGGAYLGNHWLDATVNLQLGTTVTIPYLGQVYSYVSSGPEYDFNAKTLGAYNFAGAIKKFDLSKTWTLTVGAGAGDISTLKGTVIAGGLSLTKKF